MVIHDGREIIERSAESDDSAAGRLTGEIFDLVVIGHLTSGTLPRHGNGNLARALHKPDRIARMRNHDVRPRDALGHFAKTDERGEFARWSHRRGSGLRKYPMTLAQWPESADQTVERPSPHTHRDEDLQLVVSQSNSPT